MISEGGAVPPESAPLESVPPESGRVEVGASMGSAEHTDDTKTGTLTSPNILSLQMNKFWTKLATRALERVGRPALEVPPDVVLKAYRRTQLAEDLLNDVKEGIYSTISKRSVAIIGSGLALASNLGQSSSPVATRLGSACVSLLVTELWAEELRRYCRFKNYELQHYFG